ncbi:MAG: hypothetical protein ACOY37_03235 [Pseudomonadota bacterium]
MRRICLCLLIAFASAGVGAREVKLSSPDGGSCAEADASPRPAKQKIGPAARASGPARETRTRPSLHSDSDPTSGRPRWHSFLPGMFR